MRTSFRTIFRLTWGARQRIAQAGFDAVVTQQLVQANGLRFLGLPSTSLKTLP